MLNLKAFNLLVSVAIVSALPVISIGETGGSRSLAFNLGKSVLASPTSVTTQRVQWKPNPNLGKPGSTLSGGRRGGSVDCPVVKGQNPTTLTLLVPENDISVYTISQQPTFAWYVKTQRLVTGKFDLYEPGLTKPLYTYVFQAKNSGLTSVQLPKSIQLNMGTRYRWQVKLACNNDSNEPLWARSFVERVALNDETQLATKSVLDRAKVYASEGLWYDALQSLLGSYQSNPRDPVIKAELKSLLQQADKELVNVIH